MSKKINFGIDLGTTNSSISKYENGNVKVYKNPTTLKETIASAIAFRNNRIVIGDKSLEFVSSPNTTVFSHFKRKMGTAKTYTVSSTEETYTPEQLSAIIVKELINGVQDSGTVESTVITIPAAFDTVQSNATKEAGLIAGLKEVILLQEPIAASIAYTNKTEIDLLQKKWLIYDLGGGTFDIALMGIEDGEMKVLDHEGDNYLGGKDFDQAIVMDIILPAIEDKLKWRGIKEEIHSKDPYYDKLFRLLLYKAEEVKKILSTCEEVDFELEFSGPDNEYKELVFPIHRSQFNNVIASMVERSLKLTEDVLVNSKISVNDVDYIFLVGGSTYIPFIRNSLERKFGMEVRNDVDPTTAVTMGASFYANTKISRLQPSKLESQKVGSEDEYIDIKKAFQSQSAQFQELFLFTAKGDLEGLSYRIRRKDGGFDSGKIKLEERNKQILPLLESVTNQFELNIYNSEGSVIQSQRDTFEISQGLYSIHGQPLPEDICIEIDLPEESKSYLEPIFKKGDVLPLKKNVVKQVARNIQLGTSKSILINIYEGYYEFIPAATKLIGQLKIAGSDLERSLVKGTDIDIEFEMSESRDLYVSAYVNMTDQTFEDVFSPEKTFVDEESLKKEFDLLSQTIMQKTRKSELDEKYETAKYLNMLSLEIRELSKKLDQQRHEDSDELYQIANRKREIANEISVKYEQSLIQKEIEKLIQKINQTEQFLNNKNVDPKHIEMFKSLKSSSTEVIKSGELSKIRRRREKFNDLMYSLREKKDLSFEELVFTFIFYKNINYQAQDEADGYIKKGENAIKNNNRSQLEYALIGLHTIFDKEGKTSDSNQDFFTGLR